MPRRNRRPATDPKVAVAYVRVSTDDQALGPEAQREALSRWAAAQGVRIAATFDDLGVSGGAELHKRPGLVAALEALPEHNAGLLVVAKRDRLARDVVLAAMVERLAERAGARIVAADGTGNAEGPEGMLLRGLVDLFAQYERALIRSRTAAALAVKRARGERVGEVPIGFAAPLEGTKLAEHVAEQTAIGRIRELRASGASIRAIAATLNAEGVRARGARWHPTTVARVLDRAVV
jgi:DNA invertase Pin-like site-specific DNA recombinase